MRKYRILELAEARGFKNQNELAASLGVMPQSLSQLLGNKRNFTKETLEKLLTCLDCEIEDLLEKNID
ncbi:MAG: helix-turn-helix transcriptional regulator [Opitutae bacterium]